VEEEEDVEIEPSSLLVLVNLVRLLSRHLEVFVVVEAHAGFAPQGRLRQDTRLGGNVDLLLDARRVQADAAMLPMVSVLFGFQLGLGLGFGLGLGLGLGFGFNHGLGLGLGLELG
jgi:hypothetical protein